MTDTPPAEEPTEEHDTAAAAREDGENTEESPAPLPHPDDSVTSEGNVEDDISPEPAPEPDEEPAHGDTTPDDGP